VRFHAHDVDGKPVYTGVFRERSSGDRDREFRTFRNLVEHAGHAIYVTDTDGTIEYVNPAFTRHTGYEPEQVIGETPAVLNSGEMSDEYFVSLWETLCAGEVWEEEIVDRRKDGTHYHAHQTIAPVFDDAGTVSPVRRHPDRRDGAEGGRGEAETVPRHRRAARRPHHVAEPRRRVRTAQRGGERVRRYLPRGTVRRRRDRVHGHRNGRGDRRATTGGAPDGEPVEYEVSPSFERSGRDATFSTRRYPYYDGAEALAGTFAICRDVTEIKEREADLELYERAVDGATDLIAAVDRDERFLFANEQYRTYHGIGDADITGLTLADAVGDDSYPDVRRQMTRALAGQSVEYRAMRRHPVRGTRMFDVLYYPLEGPDKEDNRVVGVVGVLRDVTDSENRAHQLRVVDRVLQHNLRNAMTVVRGRAQQVTSSSP